MSKLLILDVFGLLCAKLNPDTPALLPIIQETKHYRVVARPHLKEFLAAVFSRYTVAIFSSSSYYNVSSVLNTVMTRGQLNSCLFIWTRDRTHLDPEGEHEHSTVKRLSDVLDNPVLNSKRAHSWSNTLMCDDTLSKMAANPEGNVLTCQEFTGDAGDAYLLTLLGEIEGKFAAMR